MNDNKEFKDEEKKDENLELMKVEKGQIKICMNKKKIISLKMKTE